MRAVPAMIVMLMALVACRGPFPDSNPPDTASDDTPTEDTPWEDTPTGDTDETVAAEDTPVEDSGLLLELYPGFREQRITRMIFDGSICASTRRYGLQCWGETCEGDLGCWSFERMVETEDALLGQGMSIVELNNVRLLYMYFDDGVEYRPVLPVPWRLPRDYVDIDRGTAGYVSRDHRLLSPATHAVRDGFEGINDFVAVESGSFLCAWRSDRSVLCDAQVPEHNAWYESRYWKDIFPDDGMLCGVTEDDELLCESIDLVPFFTIPPGTFVSAASANDSGACWIDLDDHRVRCVGTPSIQQGIPSDTDFEKVFVASAFNACAMRADDSVVCWGIPNSKVTEVPTVEEMAARHQAWLDAQGGPQP